MENMARLASPQDRALITPWLRAGVDDVFSACASALMGRLFVALPLQPH